MALALPSTSPDDQAPSPAAASEIALVGAMVEGSPFAWREFTDRYESVVRGAIGRIVGRFARTVSEDDVAEIHAQLQVQLCADGMAKLRAFDPARGRSLSSWVALLAVHCTYGHLRALRRQQGHVSIDECDEREELHADVLQPDEALDLKERASQAGEILAGFSERDRELATLCFAEGLDPEQVAARMGISVKTVYSKKAKIQSRLEARLSRRTGRRAGLDLRLAA
jgi:RNA polymerase sigma-70 factor (ECF subfamily)